MTQKTPQYYTYAIDEFNKLIHIDNAVYKSETAPTYRCVNPECSQELSVERDTKNEGYFKHKYIACPHDDYEYRLAQEMVYQAIKNKHEVELLCPCYFCGKKNVPVSLKGRVASPKKNFPHANDDYVGDVVTFKQDKSIALIIEISHPRRISPLKVIGSTKWVKFYPSNIIGSYPLAKPLKVRSNQKTKFKYAWPVLSHSGKNPNLSCSFCQDAVNKLLTQSKSERHIAFGRIPMQTYAKMYMYVMGNKYIDNFLEELCANMYSLKVPYLYYALQVPEFAKALTHRTFYGSKILQYLIYEISIKEMGELWDDSLRYLSFPDDINQKDSWHGAVYEYTHREPNIFAKDTPVAQMIMNGL